MTTWPDATPAQQPVLEAMLRLERETGWPPMMADICAATGTGKSTVYVHLTKLISLGYVERRNAKGPYRLARTLTFADGTAHRDGPAVTEPRDGHYTPHAGGAPKS